MAPVHSLLDLYPSILVPVFADWIDEVEVCRVDTACCNSVLRPQILKALSKCFLSNKEYSLYNAHRNEWMINRGIGLRSFRLTDYVSTAERQILKKSTFLESMTASSVPRLIEFLDICPSIRSLRIDCEVTDSEFVEILRKIRDLETLDVNWMTFGDINGAIVSSLPHLKCIVASHDISEILLGCREIQDVTTSLCDEHIVAALIECPNLTRVHFSSDWKHDRMITNADVLPLIEGCPNLSKLTFSYNSCTNDVVLRIAQCCQLLTELDVDKADITDEGLTALANQCKQIESLKFSSELVSDAGILSVARGLVKLRKLSMKKCHQVTDVGILTVLRFCSKLQYFAVSSNSATDVAYLSAFTMCPTLSYFDISCDGNKDRIITSRVLLSNIRDAVDLSIISYHNCVWNDGSAAKYLASKVTLDSTGLKALFLQCPRLVNLTLMDLDIFDSIFAVLGLCCPLLQRMKLISSTLSFSTVIQILDLCVGLERLILSGHKLTNFESAAVGAKKSGLKFLTVTNTKLHDTALLALSQKCPLLQTVKLKDCKQVSNEGVNALITNCGVLYRVEIEKCRSVNGSKVKIAPDSGRNVVVKVKS